MTRKKASAAAMTEPCESYCLGSCECFNEVDAENRPTGCDDGGDCMDKYNRECDDYAEIDEHCPDCGKKYENCDCED